MKKYFYFPLIISVFFFYGCASNKIVEPDLPDDEETETVEIQKEQLIPQNDEITLLFAGDIMAHNVNYNMKDYNKIWKDVKHIISDADLSFGNIEAPVDSTKPASSYPNFNMPKKYLEATIDAGFDVFSLSNNHTNDQLLTGIQETIKTTEQIAKSYSEKEQKVYFSGVKETPESPFTYNIIEKNGWKIIFLPVTELLNRPNYATYINYFTPTDEGKAKIIEYIKKIKAENPCDLFILSIHTNEVEYKRSVPETQESFYKDLLAAGVDIIWANHAHVIKDRKVIVNTQTGRDQLIMYANGNTISGQRTKPELPSKNPNSERDNTGDGLLYKVTLKKNDGSLKIQKAEPIYITTYINTAYEYVIKPLNQDFVKYLYGVPRDDWAKYIERRIKINKDATKDLIEWQ